MSKELVYVAAYSHEYGTDVRVFRTEKAAWAWADELGAAYWDDAFPGESRPTKDIGRAYFERMWDTNGFHEDFAVLTANIED